MHHAGWLLRRASVVGGGIKFAHDLLTWTETLISPNYLYLKFPPRGFLSPHQRPLFMHRIDSFFSALWYPMIATVCNGAQLIKESIRHQQLFWWMNSCLLIAESIQYQYGKLSLKALSLLAWRHLLQTSFYLVDYWSVLWWQKWKLGKSLNFKIETK